MRDEVYNQLGYRASAGISHNKTLAKLASAANKPNAQTAVPVRYIGNALKNYPIKKIRFMGRKLGEYLNS